MLDFIISDAHSKYPSVAKVTSDKTRECGGNVRQACENRVSNLFIFPGSTTDTIVYIAPRCAMHSIGTEINLQQAEVQYIRKEVA